MSSLRERIRETESVITLTKSFRDSRPSIQDLCLRKHASLYMRRDDA